MNSKLLKPNDEAIYTQVENEVVFLSMEAGSSVYFGLRGAGVRIWQLIETGEYDPEGIVTILAAEFDADVDVIRADVARIVADLDRRGMLQPR